MKVILALFALLLVVYVEANPVHGVTVAEDNVRSDLRGLWDKFLGRADSSWATVKEKGTLAL